MVLGLLLLATARAEDPAAAAGPQTAVGDGREIDVTLKTGEVVHGRLVTRTATEIVVLDAAGQARLIAWGDVAGLRSTMTDDERAARARSALAGAYEGRVTITAMDGTVTSGKVVTVTPRDAVVTDDLGNIKIVPLADILVAKPATVEPPPDANERLMLDDDDSFDPDSDSRAKCRRIVRGRAGRIAVGWVVFGLGVNSFSTYAAYPELWNAGTGAAATALVVGGATSLIVTAATRGQYERCKDELAVD